MELYLSTSLQYNLFLYGLFSQCTAMRKGSAGGGRGEEGHDPQIKVVRFGKISDTTGQLWARKGGTTIWG